MQRPSKPNRQLNRTDTRNVKYPGGYKQVNSRKNEDETTVAFIKRVLCRRSGDSTENSSKSVSGHDVDTQALEDLLPPLTSSNTVDVELYALIATILDNFVHSWYSRITPDAEFTDDVIRIIAHCTRGLEQRLRHVNLEALLLDELPELALKHVEAVRNARKPYGGVDSRLDQRSRFHVLQPRMALYPPPADKITKAIQQENEDAWCLLLVHRVLPLVLPPEDLQNPCLKVLVSEVLAEVVFRGGIIGKASEGWLWWQGITTIIHLFFRPQSPDNDASIPASPVGQLDQYGLLSSSSAKKLEVEDLRDGQRGRFDAITTMFWSMVQTATLVWLFLRSFAIMLAQAQSLPNRTNRFRGKLAKGEVEKAPSESENAPPSTHDASDDLNLRPIIDMRIWACISRIVELDEHMPWLGGLMSLAQWILLAGPGQLCCTNSRFDRFLSSALHEHVLTNPILVPNILRAARSALFPPSTASSAEQQQQQQQPQRQSPPQMTGTAKTEEEISAIRETCARTIVDAIPDPVRRRFFATADQAVMRADVVAACLDLFADSYVNEHLVVGVVELVAVRLFPELLLLGGD